MEATKAAPKLPPGVRMRIAGSALTPVRWAVLLGILASLQVPFGVDLRRPALVAAVAIYAVVTALLPRLRPRPFTRLVRERLLLAADLLFSAVVFHLSGGVHSPYFGLWYLAMIRTALVFGPWISLGVGTASAGLVIADELTLLGGRGGLISISLAL